MPKEKTEEKKINYFKCPACEYVSYAYDAVKECPIDGSMMEITENNEED